MHQPVHQLAACQCLQLLKLCLGRIRYVFVTMPRRKADAPAPNGDAGETVPKKMPRTKRAPRASPAMAAAGPELQRRQFALAAWLVSYTTLAFAAVPDRIVHSAAVGSYGHRGLHPNAASGGTRAALLPPSGLELINLF